MDKYKRILKVVNAIYVILSATEDKLNNAQKLEILKVAEEEFATIVNEIKPELVVTSTKATINADEVIDLDEVGILKLINKSSIIKHDYSHIDLPKHLRFIFKDIDQIISILNTIEDFVDQNYTQAYSYSVLLIHQFKKNRIEFYVTNEFEETVNQSECFNNVLLTTYDISIELLIDLIMQTGALEENENFNGISLVHYDQ